MRRSVVSLLGLVATTSLFVCAAGCAVEGSQDAVETDVEVPGTTPEIFGGSLDSSHAAVVFLYDEDGQFACTGTIIAKNGNIGYVLTAAHCTDMDYVIQCPDVDAQSCTTGYQVIAGSQIYDTKFNEGALPNGHDFSLLKFSGANSSTPVIPIAGFPDGLGDGDIVQQIGYGKTATNPNNSKRYEVSVDIDEINSVLFYHNQTDGKGICQGDSGGPGIVNGKVVGVTSFGDAEGCTEFGAQGRVQAVADWINNYIGQPVTETCDSCFDSEVNQPGGTCEPQVETCFGPNNPSTTDCGKLVACFNKCSPSDDTCVQTCANQFPNGVDPYIAIIDCWCNTCSNVCADQCDSGTSSTAAGTMSTSGNGMNGVTSGGVGGGTGEGGAGSTTSGKSSGSGKNNDDDEETTTYECACSTPGAPSTGGMVSGLFGLALGLGAMARRRKKS